MASFYKRHVNDVLTMTSHTTSATTMETESSGVQLLNGATQNETKVYLKPTNTGLLLHYQSHVDLRLNEG